MSSVRVVCGLVAACVVALTATPGEANAEPKYRVKILSDPPGATVYLNSRDSEPLGKTPLMHRLPAGNHALILELADHEQHVDSVYVKKMRWKRQTYRMKLKEIEYGFVRITAGNAGARGALIVVDGKKSGIVPRTIKMSPGAHQVEIKRMGYTPFEKWLEVTAGKKQKLAVRLKSTGGGDPDPDADPEPKVKKKKADGGSDAKRSGTNVLVAATAGIELGWRKLRYRNPQTTNLRPFDANGVGMLDLRARVHPLARKGGVLRRAAITAAISLAAPLKTNTVGGTEAVETSWRELDIGLRYSVTVSGNLSAAGALSYGATQFDFTNAGTLMDALPEVDYRYVRLAVELVYDVDKLRAFAGGAWMPILSTGVMADRFSDHASAGMNFRAGISRTITGKFGAELSAFYRRYAHNFAFAAGALHQADGAADHFFGITVGVTLRAY